MAALRRSYSTLSLYRLNSTTGSTLRLEQPSSAQTRRQSSGGEGGGAGGGATGGGESRTGLMATRALVLLAIAGVSLSSFSAGQLAINCRSSVPGGKDGRW